MQSPLLLSSLNDPDKSNLINIIHQLHIDLQKENDLNKAEQILNESLICLEKDIKNDIVYELFSLIICCFNQYPNQLLHIFNNILDKCKLNSNYIVITAAIISNLIQVEPKISIPEYQSFVDESLDEILPQIKKSDKIVVFNNEIPQLFRLNLILDLLLSTQLTKEKIEICFSHIFSQDKIFYLTNKTKISRLIHNAISAGFVDLILSFDFSKNFLYSNILIEDLEILIPQFSDQFFTQIFDQINDAFLKAPQLNLSFITVLSQKCKNLNLKIKSFERIFNFLKLNEITPQIWEYLNFDNFNLSLKVASKLYNISNPEFIFQIDSKYENLPKNLLEHWITKMTEETIESHILQSEEAYIHIYNIISSAKDKLSDDIVNQFVNLFQKYVRLNDSNKVIDKLIFSNYPPNQQNIEVLTDFINSLNIEHKNKYKSSNHMESLVDTIMEKNIIPHHSFCKLLIIQSPFKYWYRKNLYLLLYLYKFSSERSWIQKNELFSVQFTNYEDPDLIKFIQTNDLNLLVNMNNKLLMFVIQALIFTEYKLIGKIYGLTNETVLPFYAIVLKNWTKNYNYPDSLHLFPTKDVLDLFINAFKMHINSKSTLIYESIDTILCEEQKNPFLRNFFDSNIKVRIMSFLVNSLMSDDYNGNKTILFTYIISNANFFKLFQKDDFNVIKYLINYYPKVEYKNLNNAKLNLKQFKANDISKFFVNIIENESPNEVVKTLYFIENFCNNVPIFKISNISKLMEIIYKETDTENIFLIGQFLAKNKFMKEIHEIVGNTAIPINIRKRLINYIPLFERTRDEILINILADECPEDNDSLFDELFQRMMADNNSKIGYFVVLFQSINFNLSYSIDKLLEYYHKEYKDHFIIALDHVFIYHPRKEVFVPKSITKDFIPEPSEFNLSIVSELFKSIQNNSGNYKAFYALKNIACTFPFLLESYSKQIFNIILPGLDNISLFFDEEINTENETKIKSSISALSFLISSLYSNKIMDDFIDFYFENIESFSEQQIYCFNIIFYSILKVPKFQNIFIASLLNHNFIKVIQNLINKNISNEIFHDNYMHTNCLLLNQFYYSIRNINKLDGAEIDSFKKIEKAFYSKFNRYITFLPYKINSIEEIMFLNIPQTQSHEKILKFISNIENERPFWLQNKVSIKEKDVSYNLPTDFILYYKNKVHIPKINELKIRKFSPSLTSEMYNFLYTKEKWIQSWFIYKKRIPILTDHYQIINDTIKQLNKIKRSNKNSTNINNYEMKNSIKKQLLQSNLCEILYEKIFSSSNEKLLNQLYHLLFKFSKTRKNVNYLFQKLNSNFEIYKTKQLNGEDIFDELNKTLTIMIYINKRNKICLKKFIPFFLNPQNRINDQIFIKMSHILSKYYFDSSLEYSQFLHFMLLSSNDELISKSIKMCKKNYKIEKQSFQIIKQIFSNELLKNDPSLKIINQIISSFPKYVKFQRDGLIKLLDNSLERVKNEFDNDELFYYTANLLDYLTPNRSYKYKNFSLNEELKIKNFLSIPQFIRDSDPKFWEVFEKYRKLIDQIVQIEKYKRCPKTNENYIFSDDDDDEFYEEEEDEEEVVHIKKTSKHKIKKCRRNINDDEEEEEEDTKEDEIEKEKDEEEEEEEAEEEDDDEELCYYKFHTEYKILNAYPEFFSFQLRYKLFKKSIPFVDKYCTIPLLIDPDNILESSFNQLQKLNSIQWKFNFRIAYINDKGYDLGGLRRDWFIKLTREICNPNYGLFLSSEKNHHQPNPFSYSNPDHLKYFKFAGMIIARALIQEENVDSHFSLPFLRQILNQKVLLSDLKDTDEILYNSLQYILDNDIDNDEINEYYFEVDSDEYGVIKTHELKKDGSNIKVINENKKEYIDLMIDYYSRKSVEKQIKEFCDGFNSIININKIQIFSPNEFNLLTCGNQKVDVNDLKKNTVCSHPYSMKTPVVKLFFNSIKKWNNKDLSKLIMFITGSSKVPASGFKHYKEKNNPIKIQPGGSKDRLPVAHTCFNTLDLPEYSNEEELNDKFLIAIEEESFKLA